MTKAFWIRRAVMGACIAAAAATSLILARQNNDSVKIAAALPTYNQIGDFELVNQERTRLSSADLLGSVWIGDFIFTRCGGPCPRMTNVMKNLAEKTTGSALRFVSFSVDPEYDTPERLAAYAGKFGADPARWNFLTGDKETIHRLSIQHFLLGVSEIPEEERVRIEEGFNHSTKFALVDQQGRIRGYYDSEDPASMQLLLKHAAALEEAA